MQITIVKKIKMMTKPMITIKTMTMTMATTIKTTIMIMMINLSQPPRNPNKIKIVNNSFYHKITTTIIKPNK
jgi:hypothetical protein